MDRYNRGPENDVEEGLLGPLTALDSAPVAVRVAEAEPWLAALRLVLEASTLPPSEYAAANSLGVSTRTMQRYLRSIGTTFRKERKAIFGVVKRPARSAGGGVAGALPSSPNDAGQAAR
jgi:hypothetical protein